MQFSTIPGQEVLKNQFTTNISAGRVSHAQLFLGIEGGAALPLALAYAQYVNCTASLPTDSCGVCNSCKKYQKLIHPDLHFSYPFLAEDKDDISINKIKEWRKSIQETPFLLLNNWVDSIRGKKSEANKQPNINIAECHSIISKLTLTANEAKYKVLIMWLPEYLGLQANVLLKLIEEPPERTLFIFVAEKYDQILPTIQSRVQLTKVPVFETTEIAEYLINHKAAPVATAKQIAAFANGSIGLAINDLEQKNSEVNAHFVQWMRLCIGRKRFDILGWIDTVSGLQKDKQKQMLQYGLQICRDCLLYEVDSQKNNNSEAIGIDLSKMVAFINFKTIPFITEAISEALMHIERNANVKIMYLDMSNKFIKELTGQD